MDILDCCPVSDEIVSSDDETNEVTDDNNNDDQIEIDEFRNRSKWLDCIILRTQETRVSTHVGEN